MEKITIYYGGQQLVYWVKEVIGSDPAMYEIISEEEYERISTENERRLEGRPEGS